LVELVVRADHWELFAQGLGNQHTVERIAVMVRQFRYTDNVFGFDRQNGEPAVNDAPYRLRQRQREVQLAEAGLDSDFLEAGNADH